MSLRVNLKLKLSKTIKRITVKYNTFEKATYDEYLIASLVLRSKSEDEAFEYIDEITGAGSLNPHFKRLYEDISSFSKEQLERIMENSMFPVLKIDDSNGYDYYPQLNISVFQKRIYEGDIAERKNLVELLYIKEEIIDLKVQDVKTLDKPEPYYVEFGSDGNIAVSLLGKNVNIPSELFESLLTIELDSIAKYKGTVHNKVDGTGWNILNNSVVNNLFSTNNFYYDDNGDHLLIRNENIRRTEVAKMSGLYIYRESGIPYEGNIKLCERVLEVISQNKNFSMFKPQLFVKLVRNIEDYNAVEYINLYFSATAVSREIVMLVIEMLRRGVLTGWSVKVLDSITKYCSKDEYSLVYRANPNVGFTINQLILVDKNLLTEEHKKQVDDYFANLNKMKATIKEITGEITVSGLRENVKKLTSDDQTKRFSKLCNGLIGHVNKDLDNAGLNETEQWLKEAIELRELGTVMKRKLDKLS
ncbi:MAG: hypothetical protein HDP34_03515 [Clostridia bacterium]|nr:hypothetical protein [Clostridia bacterium]